MDDMEAKLGAILNNPEAMEKIMSLAQSLNPEQEHSPSGTADTQVNSQSFLPGNIDLTMLQKLGGLISQSGTDQNEKVLLSALDPYLKRDRIQKLERALRASKIARMASSFLGPNALTSLLGR